MVISENAFLISVREQKMKNPAFKPWKERRAGFAIPIRMAKSRSVPKRSEKTIH